MTVTVFDDRFQTENGPLRSLEDDRAAGYVRHVCDAKGPSDEPALDEEGYVRYLTVGRHKQALRTTRRPVSGDRLDEVF